MGWEFFVPARTHSGKAVKSNNDSIFCFNDIDLWCTVWAECGMSRHREGGCHGGRKTTVAAMVKGCMV